MSNIEVEIDVDGQAVVLRGEDDQGRFFEVRLGDEATLVLAKHLAEAGFETFRRSAGHERTAKPLAVIQDARIGVGTLGGKLFVDLASGSVVLTRGVLTDDAGKKAATWIREVLATPADLRAQKRRH